MKHSISILATLLTVVSCTTNKSNEQENISIANPTDISVIVQTDKLIAPDSIPAGYVNIQLDNQSDEMHSAHLIKIDENYTYIQVLKAYGDSIRTGGVRPDWMTHYGGVIAEPGKGDVTLLLQPGNYLWTCVMGPDSIPHFTTHEYQPLVVYGTSDENVTLENADATIIMSDKQHQLSEELKSGQQKIDIINTGSAYHLAAISKLESGKTEQDVINWFGTFQGPPPAQGIAATSAIGPGLSARLNLELEKGDYVLYCMANAEGRFHLLNGSITTFKVN